MLNIPRSTINLTVHKSYIVHLGEKNYNLFNFLQKLHEKRFVRIERNTNATIDKIRFAKMRFSRRHFSFKNVD